MEGRLGSIQRFWSVLAKTGISFCENLCKIGKIGMEGGAYRGEDNFSSIARFVVM